MPIDRDLLATVAERSPQLASLNLSTFYQLTQLTYYIEGCHMPFVKNWVYDNIAIAFPNLTNLDISKTRNVIQWHDDPNVFLLCMNFYPH